ncbi:hypothetical protein I302_102100 [Kwoniella bestiolae CBS 10118]|uniref:alpha-1,6-mannosyl-glycoprotein 6-beta-N-acetylglucosaminyltransferase n=1 Tax=Kwoniella bestiolae CBS 10118 TaxID=1296100 RepID=A0A1B9GE41_9TREE|nr:hypothetical protein I302_00787 [Kwoniella bestiolae CBS 10118]OCF29287.1 hypothetical protein I302_00787 [Kwoniella bestiolae CBS 10118]
MSSEKEHRLSSIFTSHQSRTIGIFITFLTTLLTLSVFFYLSVIPSDSLEYEYEYESDGDGGFATNRYHHDFGGGFMKPHLEEWKIWIGLSDGRDRRGEAKKIRLLSEVFQERFPKIEKRFARTLNAPALERLAHCIETNTCGRDEEKVVLLASFHFNNAMTGGTSGEDIWAKSTLEAFTSLNYTLLYTFESMDTLTLYQGLGDKVQTILWEGNQLDACSKRNESNWETFENDHTSGAFQNQTEVKKFGCIKKEGYEEGIPLEKSFTFHFWQGPSNPLGRQFTLSPENYALSNKGGEGNHYLGYSIESRCRAVPLPSSRHHRGMALGKYAKYFNTSSSEWVWGKDDILGKAISSIPPSEEGEHEKFEMIATGGHDDDKTGKHEDMYKGITNLGKLPQDEWYQTLASSKFLLGVGKPNMSPSPYDALCFGVPFINPIMSWNHSDPEDWTKWHTQHDALRPYGAPYVYHVQKENGEQLEQAMRDALATPIKSYIPPPMTKESVKQRHRTLVETDWKPFAMTAIKELYTDKDKEFPYLVL